MNKSLKHFIILPTVIAGFVLILAAPAQAQYTFAPQVQSTNTASITYNSGTGMFQYTDTNNLSVDSAGLALAGNAANFITASNGWTASLTVNLSARSIPGNGPYVAMGLYLFINTNLNNFIQLSLGQYNYTGMGGGNSYGVEVYIKAVTNLESLLTTPLGNSITNGGASLQVLSGGTSSLATNESINAVSGVLTLTNDAVADTVTGYYNGAPVGRISLTNWGRNPILTLAVVGFSGYGINVPAGTDTASNFFVGLVAPQLTLIHSGSNVILMWPTNGIGFSLRSSTNLVSTNWVAVSPAPFVVNTNNVVTNAISGTQQFYRLSQ